MAQKKQGVGLAMLAFGLFIFGGIATFGGLALVGFMPEKDVFGWGTGRGLGYLALCLGLCLSILGVLLMRIFRNRGFS